MPRILAGGLVKRTSPIRLSPQHLPALSQVPPFPGYSRKRRSLGIHVARQDRFTALETMSPGVVLHLGKTHVARNASESRGNDGRSIYAYAGFTLTDFDGRIGFDVFLGIAAEVGDGTGGKIHVITNNSRTPSGFETLEKCFFQPDPFAMLRLGHPGRISGTSTAPDSDGAPCITPGPSSVRNRLWHAGQRPEVPVDSGASQALGQIGESSHLRADRCRSLHRHS